MRRRLLALGLVALAGGLLATSDAHKSGGGGTGATVTGDSNHCIAIVPTMGALCWNGAHFGIDFNGDFDVADNLDLWLDGISTDANTHVSTTLDDLIVAGDLFVTGQTGNGTLTFDAKSLNVDAAQCTKAADITLNSGPKIDTIVCTDNAAGIIYGSAPIPDGYAGGTFNFSWSVVQTAADTNILAFDISAECRGDGTAVNATWSTPGVNDNADVTFDSANNLNISSVTATTPNGTCTGGGKVLFWRAVVDAGTTNSVALTTARILGFRIEYARTLSD